MSGQAIDIFILSYFAIGVMAFGILRQIYPNDETFKDPFLILFISAIWPLFFLVGLIVLPFIIVYGIGSFIGEAIVKWKEQTGE